MATCNGVRIPDITDEYAGNIYVCLPWSLAKHWGLVLAHARIAPGSYQHAVLNRVGSNNPYAWSPWLTTDLMRVGP